MPQIDLGYDNNGNVVTINENFGYGVIHVIAQPRYGKSIEVKNIYTQIAKHRNLIIFDYQNEHSLSRYGHWLSKDDVCFIPDLKTIENFAFYMSDFDENFDWESMGFSVNGIPLLMRLLSRHDIHENDPLKMIKIIHDLPTSTDSLEEFRFEYEGYSTIDIQNYSVKQSLLSKFRAVWDSRIIMPETGTENHEKYTPDLQHIEDWPKLIRDHPHVNINLNMFSTGGVQIARASVGKILEKLLPVMPELKPLIVVEEADKLCPNTGDEYDNTAQKQLREYCIKHQRSGVKLMFITQSPDLLDQDTLGAGMTFIFGIHAPNSKSHSVLDSPGFDYARDVVQHLRRDDDKGFRDFAIIETGHGGKFQIFTPKDSSTRAPREINLHSRFLRKHKIETTGQLRKLMFKEIT